MRGPYQPGRIPVLFIHGLWSSPESWMKMTNVLQADPLIREALPVLVRLLPDRRPAHVLGRAGP